MKTQVGKFSFKVPDGHSEAGNKIEKAFEFQVCETEAEANEVMTTRKLSLVDMVNDILKANARSNAYQSALLPYRPTEVPAEDIKERMIRDFIRLGIAEDVARAQVDALLAGQ